MEMGSAGRACAAECVFINSMKASKPACHKIAGCALTRGLSQCWFEFSRSQTLQEHEKWMLANHSFPRLGH